MITTTLLPGIALPAYSREPITSDTIVYHCPDERLYDDLLCPLLTIGFGKEILPSKETLAEEHQQVDRYFLREQGPDAWGDWFDFRCHGYPFHIHLSWRQARTIYGEPEGSALFECYLTGSIHSPVMIRLAKLLRHKNIPYISYRHRFALKDLIGADHAAYIEGVIA